MGILAVEVHNNMQNDSQKGPNPVKQFLRDKGYYIVLILCVVVVGVSGFLFVRTLTDKGEPAEPVSLSVPLTPATESTKPAQKQPATAEPAKPEETSPTEKAAETMGTVNDALTTPVKTSSTVRPVSGEILNVWSGDKLAYNETLRDWRVHEGIDFAAETGAEVAAARDGMVSAVYEDDLLGTTVALEHEGGYTSYYSNLSDEPPVSVGQAVNAGDIIGTVGESASGELALGSHLHFAVSCSGQSMDPQDFLE